MSASVLETSNPIVQQTLKKLLDSQTGFDQLVVELFDELQSLHSQLSARRRQWQDDQQQTSRRIDELQQKLAVREAELVEARRELSSVNDDLSEFRRMHDEGCEIDQVLSQERDELIRERNALETQLEAVRARAADLANRNEQQSRAFEAERQHMQVELARLNYELTENAASAPAPAARVAAPATATAAAAVAIVPAAKGETVENPVIDSVMAQFQMVQRDAARRRRQAGG